MGILALVSTGTDTNNPILGYAGSVLVYLTEARDDLLVPLFANQWMDWIAWIAVASMAYLVFSVIYSWIRR